MSSYIPCAIMSIRLGIQSSAVCPGPFLVGEPNPRKSAIDCPTLLTPSTTQFHALCIPSPIFEIRFLPQLNASLKRFVKKSPMLENRPVILSQIHPHIEQIPSQIFLKNPLTPSHTFLKMLPIVSPQLPKKDTRFSPNPLINSQMPRKMFFIADQMLPAKSCIYSQADDQSPRRTAHTILMMSSIAFATSMTASRNGPSASIIAPSTLDTTPHKVITSPPIRSKTGFKVSYNSTIVSQRDAKRLFSFSHIGRTYEKNLFNASPIMLNALFTHIQIFVKIVLTVFHIFSPLVSQNFRIAVTTSIITSLTKFQTLTTNGLILLKTVLITFQMALTVDTTLFMSFCPFFAHHSFIALTALSIITLTFSHILVTAFRKSSLVFHR